MQESREEQKVKIAEIDMQNTKIDTQNRTIALRALRKKRMETNIQPGRSDRHYTAERGPEGNRVFSPKESLVP
jgi:hypothetical protein